MMRFAWVQHVRPMRMVFCLTIAALALSCQSSGPTGPATSSPPPATASLSQTSTPDQDRFQLVILHQTWSELKLGYSFDQSWARLQQADLSDPAVVLTESDIASYDWSDQSLILTESASQRLVDAFPSTFGLWGLEDHAFVVLLDSQRLYGGIFSYPASDLPSEFPVIYIRGPLSAVGLSIRPEHSIGVEYQSFPPELRQRIEFEGVRQLFANEGKLSD